MGSDADGSYEICSSRINGYHRVWSRTLAKKSKASIQSLLGIATIVERPPDGLTRVSQRPWRRRRLEVDAQRKDPTGHQVGTELAVVVTLLIQLRTRQSGERDKIGMLAPTIWRNRARITSQ
jgi:hypothetical protein